MITLALDTTTRAGSIAVVDDGGLRVALAGDSSRSHAERLPGDLLNALASAGVGVPDVDVFAVAAGPGSFTGLRIGIATMQGLAFATGKRMAAVSALEALAESAWVETGHAAGTIGVWMDAHRGEVFSALYEVERGARGPATRLHLLDGPTVADPRAVWQAWSDGDRAPEVVIGDGAALYRDVVARGEGAAAVFDAPLLAPAIGRIAIELARSGGTIAPAAVQPIYVRRPDAEIAREAAQQAKP